MNRREFIASTIAGSAAPLAPTGPLVVATDPETEWDRLVKRLQDALGEGWSVYQMQDQHTLLKCYNIHYLGDRQYIEFRVMFDVDESGFDLDDAEFGEFVRNREREVWHLSAGTGFTKIELPT